MGNETQPSFAMSCFKSVKNQNLRPIRSGEMMHLKVRKRALPLTMSHPTPQLPKDPLAEALLLSGNAFIRKMCDALREITGAQVVLIGSLRVTESELVSVLGMSTRQPGISVASYDTCPTPCQKVLREQQTLVLLEPLEDRFPDARSFGTGKCLTYIGLPLLNPRGDTIGNVTLDWDRALTEAEAQETVALVQRVLPRIEAEACQQVVAHAFEALMDPANDIEVGSDAAVFRTIAQQAAELGQVHGAFLARTIDEEANQFSILAAFAGGRVLTELEGQVLSYDGTPCENLRTSDTFFQARGLRERYPDLDVAREYGIESYCGFGFRDNSRAPIGHLALWHNRPMSPRALNCRIVNIIASRAGLELKRYVMETERQALRETLQVRKKLDSLGLMAGTIAHDFNNQLAAVIGHTELAMLELDPAHPATRLLKVAEDGLWRARDVVGDLMDFAGNAPRSAPELLSLNELVAQNLASIGQKLPSQTAIRTDLDGALPRVLLRGSQVHQVLSNLVANGLESMEERGGSLTVRTALTSIAARDKTRCLTGHSQDMPDLCVMLEITDTGNGLDPETAERVFDPYFSVKGVSRGLGLSGVLGIARRLPAGLVFDSKEGQGTRFRLYFEPQLDAVSSQDDASAKPINPARAPRRRVLVVDDEDSVLSTVARQVESLGYEPLQASCGDEAVAMFKDGLQVQAVILDLVMPGLDGWQTLKALREECPDLPAILMSGFNKQVAHEGVAHVEVLTKPFRLSALQSHLHRLLDRPKA